jgi:hypothetical protein
LNTIITHVMATTKKHLQHDFRVDFIE